MGAGGVVGLALLLVVLATMAVVGARYYSRRAHGLPGPAWRRAGDFEPMEFEMGRVGSGGLVPLPPADRQALNPVPEGSGSEYRGFV